jgi:hypothetical protein
VDDVAAPKAGLSQDATPWQVETSTVALAVLSTVDADAGLLFELTKVDGVPVHEAALNPPLVCADLLDVGRGLAWVLRASWSLAGHAFLVCFSGAFVVGLGRGRCVWVSGLGFVLSGRGLFGLGSAGRVDRDANRHWRGLEYLPACFAAVVSHGGVGGAVCVSRSIEVESDDLKAHHECCNGEVSAQAESEREQIDEPLYPAAVCALGL